MGASDENGVTKEYCKAYCPSGGCGQCPSPSLHDENIPAFSLFMKNQHQFHATFNGVEVIPTGLNYQSIEVSARLLGVDMTPELFGDIQVLESAYLDVIRERNANG